MPDVRRAPWTPEEVDALNAYQREGRFHPYTCGSNYRTDDFHKTAAVHFGLNDLGQLHATINGWICPGGCRYTQDWADFSFLTLPPRLDPTIDTVENP